jgi:hypothetical protein
MGTLNGALAMKLNGLDHAPATLKRGLGDVWKDTAIVAASKFGRTVEVNGSLNTDHGNPSKLNSPVILAVRGHVLPEFGGDPAQQVSAGHSISCLRHFLCWFPDRRHA